MAVCSNCHQGDLSGSDQAPGLAGGDFLDRWEGQTVGDLADRIRTSMPLDDVGSLNVQLSADITAFLLQANNFPAGQEELKADRSAHEERSRSSGSEPRLFRTARSMLREPAHRSR